MTELIELIASKRVRQIINSLSGGKKTLTELSSELSISKPALLKYAREMQSCGIITAKRIKIGGGVEASYEIVTFSINLMAGDGFAFYLESFGKLDIEFPLLCQIPEGKRDATKINVKKILQEKTEVSILLAGEEFLLLSEKWSENERSSISEAVSPAKCIFWKYGDLEANDSFTSRIKEQSIVLYSKDEGVFRLLKKYKNLDVKK